MFREAFREIRFHPSRFVATLVAIAISVGFMAGVSIFVASQGTAMGKMMSIYTSESDIVVTTNALKRDVTSDQVKQAITSTAGVADVTPVMKSFQTLKGPKDTQYVTILGLPPEQFRWSKITKGAWPTKPTEIALTSTLAKDLGVDVGDTITLAAGDAQTGSVSGITNDPKNMVLDTAYAVPPSSDDSTFVGNTWLVKAAKDHNLASLVDSLSKSLAPLGDPTFTGNFMPNGEDIPAIDVGTAHDYQQQAISDSLNGVKPAKYMLMGFAAIALLVGMIIIANTFSILLAQRRRQIGLLRAVGASGGQVRGRFLAESALLGLFGSLLGVALGFGLATIGGLVLGFLGYGLDIPWTELIMAIVVGTLVTVIAAMGPSLRATQVAPLEALRPVATVEQRKKASLVRAIVCGIFVLLGVVLAVVSVIAEGFAVLSAIGGAFLMTIGILGAAPLFIPTLLRGVARILDRAGATPRLASMNAVRNPSRASATAIALMLTVGLIVTLQVGAATARQTANSEINATFPVDFVATMHDMSSSTDENGTVQVPTPKGFTDEQQKRIARLPAVSAWVPVSGTMASEVGHDDVLMPVTGYNSRMPEVLNDVPTIDDQTILVNANGYEDGSTLTLKGPSGTITGTVKLSHVPNYGAMVSEANLRKLDNKPLVDEIWLKLGDRSQFAQTLSEAEKMQADIPGIQIGGGAPQAVMIDKVLTVMLLITTALLGVAVTIALVGVANTLGLSVVERKRESALLRALGMQRGSLRWMLLIEALILALVGTLVGLLAGGFFGWLGVKAVFTQSGTSLDHGIRFAVDWRWTIGLIAVAVVAAALASIGPGRKAAMASPTEALGDE